MANTHTTLTSLFSDIADAIRSKLGVTGTIVADEFPDKINAIESGPPDGKKWTAGTMGVLSGSPSDSDLNWVDIVYAAGYFMTIATRSKFLAVSGHPSLWLIYNYLPISAAWTGLAYGNGKFVAVCVHSDNKGYSAYSTNSQSLWEMTEIGSDLLPSHITYGMGKFVAVQVGAKGSATKVGYSTDGITWTRTTIPAISEGNIQKIWIRVAYGHGRFVAITTDGYTAYSTDGITWTVGNKLPTLPSGSTWTNITYGDIVTGGRFVAIASGTNIAAWIDAQDITGNWTSATMPSSQTWHGVTFGNGKYVAIAGSATVGAYSIDGKTWIQTTPGVAGSLCTWGKGVFGAVSSGKNASYSRSTADYL